MIYEILDTGAANPRTATELAEFLGIPRRQVSAMISRERREGKPICATTDGNRPGYFKPATREEMADYCGKLRHRAGEIFKTRAACLNTLDDLPSAMDI